MRTAYAWIIATAVLTGCASKKVSQWERQTEPMSDKAAIHYEFAREAFFSGDLIPALAAGLKAVDLAPKNAEVRNILGLIYFRQGKLHDAERELKLATELDPAMPEAFNNLGTVYLASQKYAEAKAILMKALENPLYLYPERIQNNLGLAYWGLGDKRLAQQAFESAIKLNKNFHLPHLHVGKLFFEAEDYEKSESHLREAVKLCNNCSEQRYFLGRLLLKKNEPAEALSLFREGAKLDPEGYFGKQCQQYLVSR